MPAIRGSSKKVKFPLYKPIPKLIAAPVSGATVFTPNEIVALRNVMRVISRRMKHHAFIIYTEFFSHNETLLSRFRYGGKLNVPKLNLHVQRVLKMYEEFAEGVVGNHNVLCGILALMEAVHSIAGVPKDEMALMTKAVNAYFLKVLHSVSSPTLVTALDKLYSVFLGTLRTEYQASKFMHLTNAKHDKMYN